VPTLEIIENQSGLERERRHRIALGLGGEGFVDRLSNGIDITLPQLYVALAQAPPLASMEPPPREPEDSTEERHQTTPSRDSTVTSAERWPGGSSPAIPRSRTTTRYVPGSRSVKLTMVSSPESLS